MVSWIVVVKKTLFILWEKSVFFTMADLSVDVSKLPEDVRDKLAELDLELSEGNNLSSAKPSLHIFGQSDR